MKIPKRRTLKRETDLLNLLIEISGHQAVLDRINSASYLCAALWIATKGTKMEHDAREIIKELYPPFFEGEIGV